MLFVINNRNIITNADVQKLINEAKTIYTNKTLSNSQKGVYFHAKTIFNKLPNKMKLLKKVN